MTQSVSSELTPHNRSLGLQSSAAPALPWGGGVFTAPVGSQGSGRGHPSQQRAMGAGAAGWEPGQARSIQGSAEVAPGGGEAWRGQPHGTVCALSDRGLLWADLAAGARGTEDCTESKIHLSPLPCPLCHIPSTKRETRKGNRSWRGQRSHDRSRVDNHTHDCVVPRAFS